MSDLFYVYGFVPAAAPAPAGDLVGIDGRPVEEIAVEGVRVILSRLPAAEYGEEELRERLSDLGWVAARGLSHEQVVTWFVDRGGIVPARFLTLHESREGLEKELRGRAGRIHTLVTRFEGLREWNLKALCDRTVLEASLGEDSPEIRKLDEEVEAASPGRRYLLERRRSELAEEAMDRAVGRIAEDVVEEVGALAEGVVRIPLSPKPRVEADEEGGAVILNAAFLVGESSESELRARVDSIAERLAGRGIRITFSGPWAPYRFIEKEDEA